MTSEYTHNRTTRRHPIMVPALAICAGIGLGLTGPAAHADTRPATPAISQATQVASVGGTAVTPTEATDKQRLEVYTTPADLNDEQRANANIIIQVGQDSPAIDPAGKDNVIHSALMAAMQESSLINLNYGDADSLGLFQQRPSMGWGSPEQIMDPVFATQSFYGINSWGSNPGAIQQDGWQTMDPGVLAQKVQISAYPDRYAQWFDLSVQLLNDYRAANPA